MLQILQFKEAALKLKDRFIGGSVEKSLEEATSNTDNLNVPTRILNDIADRSYNPEEYDVILKHVWFLLGSPVDKWRRIIKTLNLMEYLLKNGCPRFAIDFREEIFRIRMLTEFTHKENGDDKSASIVDVSVRLNEMLENEDFLNEERRKADVLRLKLKNLKVFSGNSSESSSVPKYEGFSSKEADLFLKMSSGENHIKIEKSDESLERVPPENYMRDGDFVMKKHNMYNIDLTEDQMPDAAQKEINLLDIDLLNPAESAQNMGLRDISNLGLNNKAKSMNTQIWNWDEQVYNKYASEQTNEEFDWSKASQNSSHQHSNFSSSVPQMYNRSVSVPEGNFINKENEKSLSHLSEFTEAQGRQINLI